MSSEVNLNETFKGKVIQSIMMGNKGQVILKTEDGFQLNLQPSFDVEYNEPEEKM
jgi:hypothetical protein